MDSTCITTNRIGWGRLKECFPPSPFQPLTPVSHHEHVYFLSSKTYQNAHPIFISPFPNGNPRPSQGPDPTCRSLSRLRTGLFSPPVRVSAQVTPVPAFTPTVLHSPPPLWNRSNSALVCARPACCLHSWHYSCANLCGSHGFILMIQRLYDLSRARTVATVTSIHTWKTWVE